MRKKLLFDQEVHVNFQTVYVVRGYKKVEGLYRRV